MLSSCARRALWPFWLGRTRAAAAAARAGHSPLIRVLMLYVWLGVENQLESLSSPAVYVCCVLYSCVVHLLHVVYVLEIIVYNMLYIMVYVLYTVYNMLSSYARRALWLP